MNRLQSTLANCRANRRKALAVFLTAGYPSIDLTLPLVEAVETAGADLIELGIPFSDPIADGPVIQESSETALRNGMTLAKIFTLVSEIRKQSAIPLGLMGYANPIFAFGHEQFIRRCAATGVDGVIVPDLTLEEGIPFREATHAAGISSILLTAPTTPADRIRRLDEASSGFLYCVSSTGVTGTRADLSSSAGSYLAMVRETVKLNPLLVGFGIATPGDARSIAALSDGVIIGSSLINIIRQKSGPDMIPSVMSFITSIRTALDQPSNHT
jgi:tryptophan synthase alpha chain